MKQILYTLMALLAVITTSCSNDDIVIEKTGKFQTVSYQVNVQNMYDEFGITEMGIRDFLRNRTIQIGIKTFIYDTAGNKVDESFVFTNKLDPIVNNVELTDGSYTMVVVETYVDPDTQEPVYHFEDEESISTLNLSIKYYNTYWYQVVGVGYQTINVEGNHVSTTITPHAVGSIIDVNFLNYQDSPFTEFAFGTADCVDSYKLDPKLGRTERYTTVDTDEGYTNIRGEVYASNEYDNNFGIYILEPSIKAKFYVRKNTTEQNRWEIERDIPERLELLDGGYYYAGSYYVGSDYYSDWYFGDDYSKFLTWVQEEETYYTLVPNLDMVWGSSVSNVQASMSGYEMYIGQNGNAVLQEEGTYALAYWGNGKVYDIIYNFTSASTGLFQVYLRYAAESVTEQELINYLDANYKFEEEESGVRIYSWNNNNAVIVFYQIDGGYCIMYMDANILNLANESESSDVRELLKTRGSSINPRLKTSNNATRSVDVKPSLEHKDNPLLFETRIIRKS